MHLFLKLHTLAAQRGDGLRPEWVDLLLAATSADEAARAPVQMTVVTPPDPIGRHTTPTAQSELSVPSTALKAADG